jgi:hypothetical protein
MDFSGYDVKKLLSMYHEISVSKKYIIGGNCGDIWRFAVFELYDLMDNIYLDIGSKTGENGSITIRFRFTNEIKQEVKNNGIYLCTNDETKQIKLSNKGYLLEFLVHRYFGRSWQPDNKKWYEYPDIAVNGINYQIKGHKATFCNIKTLYNAYYNRE